MTAPATPVRASRWPHRLAVALVCATFPLLWVGGLVTTYDAGMAVPDWPTTYGYNLWLYPWQTWLLGPWDLFIEHGHRLLGTVVGLLTIALAVSTWWLDDRRWLRWLATAAIAGVIAQGVLGGLRVRMDDASLARLHGCVGPAFFALTVALAVVTSRWWRDLAVGNSDSAHAVAQQGALPPSITNASVSFQRLALVTTMLAYSQLVLGAVLRHMPVWASSAEFRTVALFHILVALALLVHGCLLLVRVRRAARTSTAAAEQQNHLLKSRWSRLTRPAWALAGLLAVQIGLGLATWIAKYGWPTWLGSSDYFAGYVVTAESLWQAHIITAHVATGSLILAVSLMITLRGFRLSRSLAATSRLAPVSSLATSGTDSKQNTASLQSVVLSSAGPLGTIRWAEGTA